MIPQQTIDQLQELDLLDLCNEMGIDLDRNHCAPCPKCGGTDRFNVNPINNRWYCRQAEGHTELRTGDAIALVRLVYNCSFSEAVDRLTKQLSPAPISRPQQQPAITHRAPGRYDAKTWAHRWSWLTDKLTDDSPGGVYLASRGISGKAWAAWRLGLGYIPTGPGQQHPALALPVLDSTGEFVLHGWRPLPPLGSMSKFMWAPDSNVVGQWFGRHLITGGKPLFVVEGCLNGVSLWQEAGDLIDVACIGSATFTPARDLLDLVRAAPLARVWADPDKDGSTRAIDRLSGLLGVDEQVLSIVEDGAKLDANQVLQMGHLRELVLYLLALSSTTPPASSQFSSITAEDATPRNTGRWEQVTRPATLKEELARLLNSDDPTTAQHAYTLARYLDSYHDDYTQAYNAAFVLGVAMSYGIQWGELYQR